MSTPGEVGTSGATEIHRLLRDALAEEERRLSDLEARVQRLAGGGPAEAAGTEEAPLTALPPGAWEAASPQGPGSVELTDEAGSAWGGVPEESEEGAPFAAPASFDPAAELRDLAPTRELEEPRPRGFLVEDEPVSFREAAPAQELEEPRPRGFLVEDEPEGPVEEEPLELREAAPAADALEEPRPRGFRIEPGTGTAEEPLPGLPPGAWEAASAAPAPGTLRLADSADWGEVDFDAESDELPALRRPGPVPEDLREPRPRNFAHAEVEEALAEAVEELRKTRSFPSEGSTEESEPLRRTSDPEVDAALEQDMAQARELVSDSREELEALEERLVALEREAALEEAAGGRVTARLPRPAFDPRPEEPGFTSGDARDLDYRDDADGRRLPDDPRPRNFAQEEDETRRGFTDDQATRRRLLDGETRSFEVAEGPGDEGRPDPAAYDLGRAFGAQDPMEGRILRRLEERVELVQAAFGAQLEALEERLSSAREERGRALEERLAQIVAEGLLAAAPAEEPEPAEDEAVVDAEAQVDAAEDSRVASEPPAASPREAELQARAEEAEARFAEACQELTRTAALVGELTERLEQVAQPRPQDAGTTQRLIRVLSQSQPVNRPTISMPPERVAAPKDPARAKLLEAALEHQAMLAEHGKLLQRLLEQE